MTRRVEVGMNLLWCRPGVGGSEDYLVRQLLGLSDNDHEFELRVFAPQGFSERHKHIAKEFPVIEAPSECVTRAVRVALEHSWLPIVSRSVELMHHGGGTLPRAQGKPSVLTVHDIQWAEYPHYVKSFKLRYLRTVVPSSAKRATRIAVPSQFVANSLVQHLGVESNKIHVVPHGMEKQLGVNAASPDTLRRKYSLGTGPVIVYPAITHPHKNHRFLLQLLASDYAVWSDPTLRLVLTGSQGHAEADVMQMVSALGLEQRVVRTGYILSSERDGLIAMADAVVFPSEYEGFGAPVVEAMTLGVPVVCSNRTSLPEVVGDAGIVLPLDIQSWADALVAVRARRDELSSAGQTRAAWFTAQRSAAALVQVYREALT
ncbi:MAG: glycosyltransferase family 1 protein [Ilumatobacteraceae bacterium]|nr:glycosyltransferase family 1 protein [Ilumatobacteraceae bacterium]